MSQTARAIEVAGRIDRHHRLVVDEDLPVKGPTQVRVIVLLGADEQADEDEWLRAAARSQAYAFLADPAEDIYTLRDGKAVYEA